MPLQALHIALHLGLALLLPPLLLGIIGKTKAAFAGRVGAPYLQPYHDIRRLLAKGSVISVTTTPVFQAGPVVGLGATAAAMLLIPLGNHAPLVSFRGDALLLVYLFGLARFFTTAAALDTGSAFEGMGAAREVTFAALAEPAFFFGLLVLARVTGATDLGHMFGPALGAAWAQASAPLALVTAAWFVVLLVENCRIPFDDPRTHLELTMIHEVMVLDHSGPALGLIHYAAALKLLLYSALLVRVAMPVAIANPWLDWLFFIAAVCALAIGVGVVESIMARLRLTNIPKLLVGACLASGFGLILLARQAP